MRSIENINDYEIIYDDEYFVFDAKIRLMRILCTSLSPNNIKIIEKLFSHSLYLSLNVSINHTYNDKIHKLYQLKRLHSTIQNMRKVMTLRPWNHISVILDGIYANDGLKNDLSKMLMNATVTITNYDSDDNDGYIGTNDTSDNLCRCEKFIYEKSPIVPIDCDIIGRVTVCFSKSQ